MGKEGGKLASFLSKYVIIDKSNRITHTGLTGGKWQIPSDKTKKLYKCIEHDYSKKIPLPLLVEKMGDNLPFLIDLDFKYTDEIKNKAYNNNLVTRFTEYTWSVLSDNIELTYEQSEALILEKKRPYLVKTQKNKQNKYKSKDGIHIVFPKIIMNKEKYRFVIDTLFDMNIINQIFEDESDITPSNLSENTILDSKFSGWQPYLCSKEGEEPYLLTNVYHIYEGNATKLNDAEKEINFTKLKVMNKISLNKIDLNDTLEYKEIFTNEFKKKMTRVSSIGSMSMSSSSGSLSSTINELNEITDSLEEINPYKQKKISQKVSEVLQEEELNLMKSFVTCLSKDRADDYGKWLEVGLCLFNIDPRLFVSWDKFSQQSDKYDKKGCFTKWISFQNAHTTHPLTVASLYYWAKGDNEYKYKKIMEENLSKIIECSIYAGPDANFRICEVIHKYFENQYISVDIENEWYQFKGDKHRWDTTLKATDLKMGIHKEIYEIYHQKQLEYRVKTGSSDPREAKQAQGDHDMCADFCKKLLKESYVRTLIDGLGHMFYEKKVIEKFDENVNLLGFENGVIDLKTYEFREGRPDDYITMSTGLTLPVDKEDLPISFDKLWEKTKQVPHFNIFNRDILQFMVQVFPDTEVRNYVWRWLSKCLSGENRDQGFYIWNGEGSNGKSVLIDLMNKILGDYAGGLPVQMITKKRGAAEAANPAMAQTKGKRLIVMSEPEMGEEINTGLMKELTGGDRIKARHLFKECFEFIPHFKMLTMCNALPQISADDHGSWRRMEVVPFVSTFTDDKKRVNPERDIYPMDKTIKEDKFEHWSEIFMVMLLKEWMKYDKEGIDIPEKVKSATKDYRNENNVLGQFIDLCDEVDNNENDDGSEIAPTDFEDIFYQFTDWIKKVGHKPQDKKKTMADMIKWQRKSKFGIQMGKRKSDKCVNGTTQDPKFNLVYTPE